VDAVIRALEEERAPRVLVAEIARSTVEEARERILGGEDVDVLGLARRRLRQAGHARPRRLINATGVLLHTNLGRAPIHPEAATAAHVVATGYSNVELDLESGERGGRGAYIRRLLVGITGAEAALVVNNNAAGLFLTLAALASGRPVPVSRGELIEIGGSYRLPELMAASGARLVEVGTTNRTRASDYEAVIGGDTALILKVHPSNYRVVGFSEEAPLADLVTLARNAGLPVVYDIGSGLLDEDVPWIPGSPPAWLRGEPGVRQALDAGADLVLFSGDKLLGGPQAGIAVGRADLIDRLASHPIARAVRTDGSTLAALAETLELYGNGRAAELPFWSMALAPYEDLASRITKLAARASCPLEITEGESVLGAGSVSGAGIPTPLMLPEVEDADAAWQGLLQAGVVARRDAGRLVLDLRAVPPEVDAEMVTALAAICRS
jgi:L-seryl-tRNA(Ser) seleniumtransferase